MNDKELQDCGAYLADMRRSNRRIGELPEPIRPKDESEAYRVQDVLHARLSANGLGPLAGYKIGCTTKVMQQYLGIGQPCRGGMYASRITSGPTEIRLDEFRRLGVECEIAVRLASDLPPGRVGREPADVAAACDAWMASIEVVEDRYDNYGLLGAATLIADDFFHAACVLGPSQAMSDDFDVAAESGRLLIDGAEVGHGQGRDILGHPLAALAWLADNLNTGDRMLKAGDIVTLGSVVKTVWIDKPALVEARFDTLGSAVAEFVA